MSMTIESFMENVFPEPNTGCWLWAGRFDNRGYGRGPFGFGIQLAHRFSYLILKADPSGNHVLHHCDVPACVNPDHLYLGDQTQNNLDRDRRGRQKTFRGCEHTLSRFTEDDIRLIRSLYPGIPSRKLGKKFKISQRAILNIVTFKSYKNVL